MFRVVVWDSDTELGHRVGAKIQLGAAVSSECLELSGESFSALLKKLGDAKWGELGKVVEAEHVESDS